MKIHLLKQFKSDFKTLAKKYRSLEADIDNLIESLKRNPTQGTALGKNRYKVQLKIASKKTGKSGGGRVITYVEIQNDDIYLLTLYDKSEMENVNDAFLDDLTKKLEQ